VYRNIRYTLDRGHPLQTPCGDGLLFAANSVEQLREIVPSVHRIFVDAHTQVIEETLGSLSAFYAMFLGYQKFNVFRCGSRKTITPAWWNLAARSIVADEEPTQ
jgi:hypothetical protein